MASDIARIEYRRGMLKQGMQPADLPVKALCGSEIPVKALQVIDEGKLLQHGGVYGDKAIGDPVEYDYLRIVSADVVVDIEFYNRGITLFMTDNETLKQIHHVMCLVNNT